MMDMYVIVGALAALGVKFDRDRINAPKAVKITVYSFKDKTAEGAADVPVCEMVFDHLGQLRRISPVREDE